MTLDLSGGFLLVMLQNLRPMLVSSRLDYCNSFFRSLSKFNLYKLQCIQNSAARIVSNTSRYASLTPVFKKLHWLPVEHRSVFKTATLVYKFLNTGFPKYFAPYISSYSSSYRTRHSQSGGNFLVFAKFQLSIRKSAKQFGFRLLVLLLMPHCLRNALHNETRASPLPNLFQKAVKTYLYNYNKAYPP